MFKHRSYFEFIFSTIKLRILKNTRLKIILDVRQPSNKCLTIQTGLEVWNNCWTRKKFIRFAVESSWGKFLGYRVPPLNLFKRDFYELGIRCNCVLRVDRPVTAVSAAVAKRRGHAIFICVLCWKKECQANYELKTVPCSKLHQKLVGGRKKKTAE